MNQANHLARRPDAKVLIPINKHFAPSLPAHQRRHLLKLARGAFLLNLHCLLRHLVLEQSRGIFPSPQHELRISLLRIDNCLFDGHVNRRLDRTHEPRPHVDALRAQR